MVSITGAKGGVMAGVETPEDMLEEYPEGVAE
jgi:hypothetical protein